ncbi:MAG: tRNA pseudouridine(38-40) synthase TruA [Bdellovibrionota bacterium]
MFYVMLTLEYDGSCFSGWQVQPNQRTIQSELLRALSLVLREEVTWILASGRTDSGVHAKGQTAVFRCEKEPNLRRLIMAVSNILKNEVSVLAAEIVSKDFHPIRDVKRKHYRYTIYRHPAPPVQDIGRVWHLSAPLDIDLMQSNAETLNGEHDFSSFRCSGCMSPDPVKTIYQSRIEVNGNYLFYDVIGSGFLKQMVRVIIGTLVEGARKDTQLLPIAEILKLKDRTAAGPTAPAHGLCLMSVDYV